MTKSEAEKLKAELESLFISYGLYYTIELDNRPELRYIRFKEVSIKVDNTESKNPKRDYNNVNSLNIVKK
jgi:hypothetical protein